MALTPSSMLPLGTKASDFKLRDVVSERFFTLADLKSDMATVFMFICNHCPYVIHIQHRMVEVAREYRQKGVSFVAISSNDVSAYPADAPDKMKLVAETLGFTFPYLYDETQEVARNYQAVCTPDFFVFDRGLACVYRGRFDEATPGNQKPVTGRDLTDALDLILAGKSVGSEQYASMGCGIKWKK